MRASILNRKLHRWGSIIACVPILVILVTGLILQLKKDSSWIQPSTRRGTGGAPEIPFSEVLRIAKGVPEAGIESWADIDRLDVRPSKGMVKVRATNRYEVQIDTKTGDVLQVAYRRSDLIESIHDGSFFHDKAKLWVFLPTAVILIGLWITGMYLWLLPHLKKRARRRA